MMVVLLCLIILNVQFSKLFGLISYFNLLKRIKSPISLHLNFPVFSHFGVNLAKTYLFCALWTYCCLSLLDESLVPYL